MTDERWIWGAGLATRAADGTVLDTWYPAPEAGRAPASADTSALEPFAGPDERRAVELEVVGAEIDLDALPAGTVETLLKPENKDQLVKILTCHVVAADVMAEALVKLIADDGGKHTVATVGGCEFTAMTKDGMVMIEDGQGNVSTVTIADVKQSNGVIHVVDTVLLPAM